MTRNYPENIDQFISNLKKSGIEMNKDEVFEKMVEYNMINEQGQPTEYALKNGLMTFEGDQNA
ncbi:hypothetical protein ACFP7A_01395 [Sporolactobacillus kofuensis]|uniref:Uncharacterized protein n=1 Tax=Sporolactobacillus kofuensis TaxID=269672 RepID=A0ABW1WDR2_9BACL|nr:hypothetical protein [Sporolactobacillus kofuensis]MCO7177050.1 hypothetical protein [Sporolactobacillus kofuensis]